MPRNDAPGQRLLASWRQLSPLPGGRWLFGRILGWMVPYSGTTAPRVESLEPGAVRVSIPDRRANRQHLGSVHAIALMNVAELASGLAMMTALPAGRRGIVTAIRIEYLKKARGRITAVSRCDTSRLTQDGPQDFVSECLDPSGAVVARATVTWMLGPAK